MNVGVAFPHTSGAGQCGFFATIRAFLCWRAGCHISISFGTQDMPQSCRN